MLVCGTIMTRVTVGLGTVATSNNIILRSEDASQNREKFNYRPKMSYSTHNVGGVFGTIKTRVTVGLVLGKKRRTMVKTHNGASLPKNAEQGTER